MKKAIIILAAVMSLVVCPCVFADDLFPPPWQRGQSGTTYQRWEFSTNNTTPSREDDFYNPNGNGPALRVDPRGDWLQVVDGRQGVWPLSGELDMYIPNWRTQNPEKWIYIQLTWKPGNNDQTPFLPDSPVIGIFENPIGTVTMLPRIDSELEQGWKLSQFKINIQPNPLEEWLTVKGDILVDQIVVDTICIPEPATILLFGISGLMTLARRKRAKV
jgi:hypothetical protein